MTFHLPVMLSEVVELLVKGGIGGAKRVFVDATIGGGGHARAVLLAASPNDELIGSDCDPDAIREAKRNLDEFGGRVRIFRRRMSSIGELLDELDIESVDGMLADLGVSSFQIDTASRGFSFVRDGPLDMRMDASGGESAADLVARMSEEELASVIGKYGEERYARRIAKAISEGGRVETTRQLAEIVASSYPQRSGRRGRIDPATRTFQAIRIAVNDEIGELARFLDSAPQRLTVGAKLVVMSYHSLEDRCVKRKFRDLTRGGLFRAPFKKVQKPKPSEIERNLRARSARLRALERVG